MDLLSALQTFVRLVERGSFSAVARERSVGQPSISKRIAALEKALGVELIRRTPRSVLLTEAGRELYEYAAQMLDELDSATARLTNEQLLPRGLVRLATPPSFGRRYVVPALLEFFQRYPDVSVELSVVGRLGSLLEDGIDLALHSGEMSDSSLLVKKIAETSLTTVATPTLLSRYPQVEAPHSLHNMPAVVYMENGKARPWDFILGTDKLTFHPKGALRTSDADQLRVATLGHMGVAQGPGWLFDGDIAEGHLIKLFPDLEARKGIFALWPSSTKVHAKVRVTTQYLEEILARHGMGVRVP